MPYVRKTVDVYRLFVNYGQGWEHEVTEFTHSAIRERVREYRENCPQYPVKWRSGRDRIEPVTAG